MVENELTPLGELLLLLCMVWYGMVCGAITGIGVVWYITLSVAGELGESVSGSIIMKWANSHVVVAAAASPSLPSSSSRR